LGHPVGSAPDDNNGHVTCSAWHGVRE
jgi:hypothetical protein